MNKNRRSLMGMTTEGIIARTLALLGPASTKAISPMMSPAETVFLVAEQLVVFAKHLEYWNLLPIGGRQAESGQHDATDVQN
jgi:hypothetical protein